MNSPGLHSFFNTPGTNASSHLYVLKTGTIEQYLDLDVISWAAGGVDGGDARGVTVETQGRDGEKWTEAQVAAIVHIILFVHEHYGVPLQLMTDTRVATAGVGWHRLGVSGNFAGLPWPANLSYTGSGQKWSKVRGKTCPGTARILQMPDIIARTKTTTNPVSEEDDMPKAIQFSSRGKDGHDHAYVAFPNAREYDYAESQGEIDDYRNILTRQGFDYEVWKNASGTANVGNPDVFGRYVGPEAARPAGAKREN